jgi:hypothetical protein
VTRARLAEDLAAWRSEVEDDLAVTAHVPLAADGGEGSLGLEAHRGEDLTRVGEPILPLAAQPLVVAGLVATLTEIEPLLQAAVVPALERCWRTSTGW